jgi:hypothetical protein
LQAVIAYKWHAFARWFITLELVLYVVWLTQHCIFSLILVSVLLSS